MFEIVLSGGKLPSPSWKRETGCGDVLQPVLAEVGEWRARRAAAVVAREDDLAAVAGGRTRAAKWTSSPT